jgi:hypothetical protein
VKRFQVGLTAALVFAIGFASQMQARADDTSPEAYLKTAQAMYRNEQYFRASRYAFAALEQAKDEGVSSVSEGEAYSWVAMGLIHARLFNAASYFFIKTLQSGEKPAIRRVLTGTQDLLVHVGADLLRKYLIRYTKYEDYDSANRSAFLYSLGKDALLADDTERAVGYLSGIDSESPLWPFSLELRGTALALRGDNERAINDFKTCVRTAVAVTGRGASEAQDLAARCQAGIARVFYQAEKFDDADRAYNHIPKSSLVWPDILFEQAWNAFSRHEYNRSLGKLVSYKSPLLSFVFNPEVDVLRAQSYLALCLYSEANDVINEFNERYAGTGEEVKQFVEQNSGNQDALYEAGKNALHSSIYTARGMDRMLNRFIRGPYFQELVRAESEAGSELAAIQRFDANQPGVSHNVATGYPGFLNQVLKWRVHTVRTLGGIYVKNGLLDYHSELIANFEKVSFIKLEMLKRAKEQLLYKHTKLATGDRGWGDQRPSRRDYQFYWDFNGEFWTDELGDYVFGLESECNPQGKGNES